MPLPTPWADALFAKLSVRWGSAFMRQYLDAEPSIVKSDWAEVLDGISGESIAYALRYLPAAPCNAMAFRDLCRRAPPAARPALTHEARPADPGRVREIMAAAATRHSTLPSDAAQRAVARMLAIAAERGALSRPQREMLVAMRARGQISATLAADVERWLPAAPGSDEAAATGT